MALYGTDANWLATTLAVMFGTVAAFPISPGRHSGRPWQETLVTAGFLKVSMSVVAVLFLVWGRWASAPTAHEA